MGLLRTWPDPKVKGGFAEAGTKRKEMWKTSKEWMRAAQTHFQLDRRAMYVNGGAEKVLDQLVKRFGDSGLSGGKKDYGVTSAQWFRERWQR